MYTDQDLEKAVEQGIFTASSVEQFREQAALSNSAPVISDENFRLIGGFNDVFVVIACSLLLFSCFWVLQSVSDGLAYAVFSGLAWALAEFFVLKKQMALPAIVLLLAFVGGVYGTLLYTFSHHIFSSSPDPSIIPAIAASAGAAYLHWVRFKVPITIAVGTAAGLGLLAAFILVLIPGAQDWLLIISFVSGLLAFAVAMYWDASDTNRTTRSSDVAFWLHLLAAPLIIHPVFFSLGVLDGNEDILSMVIVLALYLFMTLASITIDRRIFMVSSLVYVLYAIASIIKTFGGVGYSFSLTGVVMGGALLLLSIYWHDIRQQLVNALPEVLRQYIPPIASRTKSLPADKTA